MGLQKLDELFEAACDAVIEGLQANGEEAIKARSNLAKAAVELLKFSGHELNYEASPKARQISEMVNTDQGNIIEAEFTLPFTGDDQPVMKKGG